MAMTEKQAELLIVALQAVALKLKELQMTIKKVREEIKEQQESPEAGTD